MAERHQQSPAIGVPGLPWDGGGVTLEERPFCGHLNLRGDAGDAGFCGALAKVIGDLPVRPNTTSRHDSVLVLWLGPDEWLLVFDSEAAASATNNDLDTELAGTFYSLADISSAQTIFRLRGPRARDIIRSASTLDVHARQFSKGQCAQTTFAKAGIVLYPVDETPTFELVVRRSFADYLARWVIGSARPARHTKRR